VSGIAAEARIRRSSGAMTPDGLAAVCAELNGRPRS
jgi:hypothetical protein